MNIKILSILTLLFLFGIEGQAQIPQFNWGQATKHPDMTEYQSEVFEANEDGFYRVRWKYNGKIFNYDVFIDRFDGNYEKVGSVDISPPYGSWDKGRDFQSITYRDGKLYMLTKNFIKKDKKNRLYIHTISMDGEYEAEKEVTHINAEKTMNRGWFQLAFSENGKYLAVLQEPPFQKKTNESVTLGIYDENFDEIAGQTFSLEYPAKRVVKNRPVVTNDGEIFFLKNVGTKHEFNYELFHWNRLSKKLDGYKIDLDGMQVIEADIQVSEENEVIVSGYYSKKVINGVRHGWFYQRYDQTGKRLSKGMGEIERPNKNISLQHVQTTEDGGVLLMGEWTQYLETTRSGGSATAPAPRDKNFESNNIYVHKINGDGELVWLTVLKKENKSRNDGGYLNSFIYAYHNQKLYLVYNASEATFSDKKVIVAPRKVPVLVAINEKGDMNGMNLYKIGVGGQSAELRFCPNEFYKVGDGNYIVKGANSIQFKFGSMKFE